MKYTESNNAPEKLRKSYYNSIIKVLDKQRKKADSKRNAYFLKMQNNKEKYRKELAKMFGWPLVNTKTGVKSATSTLLCEENGVEVYRITFKLKIGLSFSGLLYKHIGDKKLPFVICQHGGGGTPELAGGLLEISTQNYNNMIERVVKKGANVFAPQLLLWNGNIFEPTIDNKTWEQLRREVDSSLKQVGSSITAIEIYAIKSVIDYFETKPFVDSDKIGMLGLSYGGFYTMHTTALETRIKVGFSCSQYNDRYLRAFPDWVWFNSASKFFDNEVASLIHPRKFLIAVGTNDPVFPVSAVETEFKKLKEMISGDWVELEIFEGDHEFTRDDNMLDKFFTALLK